MQTAEELQGIKGEYAVFGAVAKQVGQLNDEQVEQVIAGWLATGRRVQFSLDQNENQRNIQTLLSEGATETAQAALKGAIADWGKTAVIEAPPEKSFRRDDDRQEEVLKKHANTMGLSEGDIGWVRSVLKLKGKSREERLEQVFKPDVGFMDKWKGTPLEQAVGQQIPKGAEHKISELLGAALMVEDAAKGSPGKASDYWQKDLERYQAQDKAQPVTVHVHYNTVNMGTVFDSFGVRGGSGPSPIDIIDKFD